MADVKPDVKPSEGSKLFHQDHHKEVFYLLFGLILISILINRLLFLISTASASEGLVGFWYTLVTFSSHFWNIWKTIATILTGAGIVWGAFSFFKLEKVRSEEEKVYGHIPDDTFTEALEEDKKEKVNERWKRIQDHANSNNSSDWRLAIIEADIMLEETLRTLGYTGDGLGEMLKGIDPTDLLTLNNAWDAHKVRNRIAHSGGDFDLTERETRRVIGHFEAVFRELRAI